MNFSSEKSPLRGDEATKTHPFSSFIHGWTKAGRDDQSFFYCPNACKIRSIRSFNSSASVCERDDIIYERRRRSFVFIFFWCLV